MKTFLKTTFAIGLVAVASTSLGAIRANHTLPGYWIFEKDGRLNSTYIPLNANGDTTISFSLPGAGKKVLTYSLVCGVQDNLGWMDLDIIVNGVVVEPTVGTKDAFCAAKESSYERNSITLVIQGREGVNTVRIAARLSSEAFWMSGSHSALVIHD